jgi:hypothetical protein
VAVAAGNTFLLADRGQPILHLWVVVSEPAGNPATVATVSFTTRRRLSDDTVVLDVGDHPFIKQPTVVYYSDARIREVRKIEQGIRDGTVHLREDVSSALLTRIRDGFLRSPAVVPHIRDYCSRHF